MALESESVARRVLVITPDSLGTHMAGPAIRAFEMAKALSLVAEVRLVSTVQAVLENEKFSIALADDRQLRVHADWADVIVFQGHILSSFPWLRDDRYVLVADIYDPMHLEVLEQGRGLSEADRFNLSLQTTEVLNIQIERSDFMLCASEKQRDFWLGQLASLCRINPATYEQDESLRSLLDVAPFGISEQPPIQTRHGIKGAVPGIEETDTVILWGGGIYNWFDPLTLIRAVHSLSHEHPDLRLFFLGVKHPNPNVPEMEVSLKARQLAIELDLIDRVVFFNEGWVPYEDRANFLLDADLGVSTHFEHLETAFSFRTRILDYLWASLPIVSTDGDTFAELIRIHELGRVVPPEDSESLAEALSAVLYDAELKARFTANVAAFAERMRWSQTLKPLVAFCLAPKPATDRVRKVVSPRNDMVLGLRKRITGLESSSSWRLTAPFRWVSGIARRMRRPAPGRSTSAR
jgi:glycosyltransferase involved in cell wall biosynthesis